jgi:methionyl-tRNA synthetase
MSTSKNWAVWLHEYWYFKVNDVLRYALTSNAPETKDNDLLGRFSEEKQQ